MSNYLPNAPDYIPQFQGFNPDLNYYSTILSTKQSQYDTGLKKLSSIYGSVLNSKMLRQDNIQRRTDYFNTIDQSLKKVARMDLSMDQNVQTAEKLFDPILEDKYMVKDMVYSKGAANAYNTAEQYRNCIDPDKCGGQYWDTGVQALNYAVEEFQKASPDESLRFVAPTFTSYQNVTKKAIKAAKDAGFNISYDHTSGGYIVTDTNGQLLLGEKGDGILPQFLYGMFGNDPAVQSMYSTQAYVQRKNFTRQYATQFGSEEGAETAYINDIVSKIVPVLNESKQELQTQRDRLKINMTAAEILADKNGGVTKGDGVQSTYDRLQEMLSATDASEKYHENVENLLTSTPNVNDIKTMRSRADNIVANGLLMHELNNAAAEYAMGTAKREIKADPYALAAYNNSLDLNKAIQLKEIDQQVWLERQTLLGKIGPGKTNPAQQMMDLLRAKGVSMDEVYKLGINEDNIGSKQSIKKLTEKGLLTPEQTTEANNFLSVPVQPTANTYHDNNRVVFDAVDTAVGTSVSYLQDVALSMQREYQKAENDPNGEHSVGIRAKIIADAKGIFKETGVDYMDVVTGKVPVERLANISNIDKASYLASYFQQKDGTSKVYNSGWDDTHIMNMQVANQAARGLMQEKENMQKSVIDRFKSGFATDLKYRHIDEGQYIKNTVMMETMFDKDGNIRPVNESFLAYGKALQNNYFDAAKAEIEAANALGEGPRIKPTKNQIIDYAVNMAKEDFMKNREIIQRNYQGELKSLRSRPGSQDEGGAEGSAQGVMLKMDGDQPFDSDFRTMRSLFSDLRNNKDAHYQVFAPPAEGRPQLSHLTPINSEVANKVMDMFLNDDAKGANLRSEIQYFPGSEPKMAVRVTLDDKTARKINNLKSSDPVTMDNKSFVLVAPSDLPSLQPMVDRMTPSSADLLLRNPGKSITVGLPNKGSATIRNYKGGLYFDPVINNFNPETGEWKTINLPTEFLGNVKAEDAFKVAKSYLDRAYAMNQDDLKRYQQYQATNGKTTGGSE